MAGPYNPYAMVRSAPAAGLTEAPALPPNLSMSQARDAMSALQGMGYSPEVIQSTFAAQGYPVPAAGLGETIGRAFEARRYGATSNVSHAGEAILDRLGLSGASAATGAFADRQALTPEEQRRLQPTVGSIDEIDNLGDAAHYVAGLLGGSALDMLGVMAAGAAGTMVGGPVLGGAAALTAGGLIGTGMAVEEQMDRLGPDATVADVDMGAAGAAGAIYGALDRIFPQRVVGRVFGTGAADLARAARVKGALGRIVSQGPREALAGLITEGATEVLQDLTILAQADPEVVRMIGDGNVQGLSDAIVELADAEQKGLIDSAVGGGALGATLGYMMGVFAPGRRASVNQPAAPSAAQGEEAAGLDETPDPVTLARQIAPEITEPQSAAADESAPASAGPGTPAPEVGVEAEPGVGPSPITEDSVLADLAGLPSDVEQAARMAPAASIPPALAPPMAAVEQAAGQEVNDTVMRNFRQEVAQANDRARRRQEIEAARARATGADKMLPSLELRRLDAEERRDRLFREGADVEALGVVQEMAEIDRQITRLRASNERKANTPEATAAIQAAQDAAVADVAATRAAVGSATPTAVQAETAAAGIPGATGVSPAMTGVEAEPVTGEARRLRDENERSLRYAERRAALVAERDRARGADKLLPNTELRRLETEQRRDRLFREGDDEGGLAATRELVDLDRSIMRLRAVNERKANTPEAVAGIRATQDAAAGDVAARAAIPPEVARAAEDTVIAEVEDSGATVGSATPGATQQDVVTAGKNRLIGVTPDTAAVDQVVQQGRADDVAQTGVPRSRAIARDVTDTPAAEDVAARAAMPPEVENAAQDDIFNEVAATRAAVGSATPGATQVEAATAGVPGATGATPDMAGVDQVVQQGRADDVAQAASRRSARAAQDAVAPAPVPAPVPAPTPARAAPAPAPETVDPDALQTQPDLLGGPDVKISDMQRAERIDAALSGGPVFEETVERGGLSFLVRYESLDDDGAALGIVNIVPPDDFAGADIETIDAATAKEAAPLVDAALDAAVADHQAALDEESGQRSEDIKEASEQLGLAAYRESNPLLSPAYQRLAAIDREKYERQLNSYDIADAGTDDFVDEQVRALPRAEDASDLQTFVTRRLGTAKWEVSSRAPAFGREAAISSKVYDQLKAEWAALESDPAAEAEATPEAAPVAAPTTLGAHVRMEDGANIGAIPAPVQDAVRAIRDELPAGWMVFIDGKTERIGLMGPDGEGRPGMGAAPIYERISDTTPEMIRQWPVLATANEKGNLGRFRALPADYRAALLKAISSPNQYGTQSYGKAPMPADAQWEAVADALGVIDMYPGGKRTQEKTRVSAENLMEQLLRDARENADVAAALGTRTRAQIRKADEAAKDAEKAQALRDSVVPIEDVAKGTPVAATKVGQPIAGGGFHGTGVMFLRTGVVPALDKAVEGAKDVRRLGENSGVKADAAQRIFDGAPEPGTTNPGERINWLFAERNPDGKVKVVWGRNESGDAVGINPVLYDFLQRQGMTALHAQKSVAGAGAVMRDGEKVGAIAFVAAGSDGVVAEMEAIAREKGIIGDAAPEAAPAAPTKRRFKKGDRKAAAQAVASVVERMTGGKAGTNIVDQIGVTPKDGKGIKRSGGLPGQSRVAGTYDPAKAIVTVAMDGPGNSTAVAVHESWHFLRDKGLIPQSDLDLLAKAAPRLRKDFEQRYGKDKADLLDQEELEAYAIQTYYHERMNPLFNPIKRVLDTILDTFDRIANLLAGRGYRTVNDVFQEAVAGDFATKDWRGTLPDLAGRGDMRFALQFAEDYAPPATTFRSDKGRKAWAYLQGEGRTKGAVIVDPAEQSIVGRLKGFAEGFRDFTWSRFRQGAIDKFEGLRQLDMQASGGQVPTGYDSLWKRAHIISTSTAPLMERALTQGLPMWSSGAKDYTVSKKDGSGGLMGVIQPVVDAGALRQFEMFLVGKRARQLKAEGRERFLTDEDLAQIDAMVADLDPAVSKIFVATEKRWSQFNTAFLKEIAQSGIISKAAAEAMTEDVTYIPFHRVMDRDGEFDFSPEGIAKMRSQAFTDVRSGLHKLKGGDYAIKEPIETLARNMHSLLDRARRNAAGSEAMRVALGVGAAQQTKRTFKGLMNSHWLKENTAALEALGLPVDDMLKNPDLRAAMQQLLADAQPKAFNEVSVMVDGKPVYFEVLDAQLLESLKGLEPRERSWLERVIEAPKNILTRAVALDPVFMARNFVRDAQQAWIISPAKFTPVLDTLRGLSRSMGVSPESLSDVGSASLYDFNRLDRIVAERTGRQAKGVLAGPIAMLRHWEEVGRRIELANRTAVHDSVLAELTEQANALPEADRARALERAQEEAVYQAMFLTNYASHGSWGAVRTATALIPYLNARIQGLDRLAMQGMAPKKILARTLIRGTLFMTAALALEGALWGDDDYEELEEWQKDAYFHFRGPDGELYRFPKGFEIGLLFGTYPARALRAIRGDDDGDEFAGAIWRGVTDTLSINPIPQAALPLLEVAQNKSFFTDRPIETMGMERLSPENRYRPTTSELMRSTAPYFAWTGVSPIQAEHLVRGYLGPMGAYVLAMADGLTATATGAPARPAGGLQALGVNAPDAMLRLPQTLVDRFAGSFTAREVPTNTKFTTQFYALKSDIDTAMADLRRAARIGDVAQAKALVAENVDLLRARAPIMAVDRRLRDLRESMNVVRNSTDLDAMRKKDLLEQMQTMINRLSEAAIRSVPAA